MKGPGGTSQDPERSSFQSKACAHGVSSSSKEQHNIRFVAREKEDFRSRQGDLTRGVGIFTRTPSRVEPEDFHQVFAGGSLWKFTHPEGCTNEMLRVCLWLHKISLMEAHPPQCARH